MNKLKIAKDNPSFFSLSVIIAESLVELPQKVMFDDSCNNLTLSVEKIGFMCMLVAFDANQRMPSAKVCLFPFCCRWVDDNPLSDARNVLSYQGLIKVWCSGPVFSHVLHRLFLFCFWKMSMCDQKLSCSLFMMNLHSRVNFENGLRLQQLWR